MSLLTTILHLLDEAEVDGRDPTPANTDFTVDVDAFWKEMDREGLKVAEPHTAFGFNIFLREGIGGIWLSTLGYESILAMPIGEWHDDPNGDETLRQLAWRRYKLLPDDMKDDKWPNLINGAETLQQMTDVFRKVSALWRAAKWRKAMAVF
jgi:hypothetical protein